MTQNHNSSPDGKTDTFKPSGNGFANDLSRMMREKGISPKHLAADMCVHISTVYYWMDGRTLPTAGMIYRIALALQEEPLTLYGMITEKDAVETDRTRNRNCKTKNAQIVQTKEVLPDA